MPLPKQQLINLLAQLNHGLIERESALKAALLCVLAGENLLLVGPPGTAKSLIARTVAKSLPCDDAADGASGYFEYLLTKFSTPEEIFGPLSISELKADRFRRNTVGYLPTVRVAFLDEIFKASSSILNALLTILNERIYHNGADAQQVPLQALIAASNELPTGQEELEALFDRFLVRSFVDYVSEENLPRLLDKPGEMPEVRRLTSADLHDIRQSAQAVTLPADIVSAIQRIWAEHKRIFKEDRRENLSDRRLMKAVGLLYVSAATNSRTEVDLSDVLLLKDCLWNHPDNALKVRELVMNTLRSFSRPVPQTGQAAKSASDSKSRQPPRPASRRSAVVKGYKGSGTQYDPILIETLHDLAGLERPEVGQKGYWFRQTDDIDCSPVGTWLNIQFKGHYDGGGHAISHKSGQSLLSKAWESSLVNLHLQNLCLAAEAVDCDISACSSNINFVGCATNCRIVACYAGGRVVDGAATDCDFTHCKSDGSFADRASKCMINQCMSGDILIRGSAKACTIQDCQVQFNAIWKESYISHYCGDMGFGGITSELNEGSVVERCFVTGKIKSDDYFRFSSITHSTSASTIRQCAFGAFECNKLLVPESNRITRDTDGGSKLENNVALDCHSGTSDPNGLDGKSLSDALFTAHYFEHSLGWNFETVWQWNDAQNQPELRSVGVEAVSYKQRHAAPEDDMGDLLTQQVTANLWL